MEMKVFSDLVDALGKAVEGLKRIAALPKVERDRYRRTIGEAYCLIDTTLNMIVIRLGDVLLRDDDSDFAREVAGLSNYQGWINVERELRLCQGLRAALRETETLSAKIVGALSARDWEALLGQMRAILGTEGDLASFINQQLNALSRSVGPGAPGQEILAARQGISAFRDVLLAERRRLITQEIELDSIL